MSHLLHDEPRLAVVLVSRGEWEATPATEAFIRNRFSATGAEKTSIQIHHTAGVDNDPTPNQWSYQEAVNYMKRLEWVRPDLGPLPYSFNPAASETDDRTVWIFEGRGVLKVGAHTAGHNRDGIGYGNLGNFQSDVWAVAGRLIAAIEIHARYLKASLLPNLGTLLSPDGNQAWGHRDSKATTCPGAELYKRLDDFDLDQEADNEMETNIAAMRNFGTSFWLRCQSIASEPKSASGELTPEAAAYWGEDRAQYGEWVDAYPKLWPAALQTMAVIAAAGPGPGHAHTATTTIK